jgi:hypothetical protein
LHPNKVLINDVEQGFPFLGQFIKPFCSYVGNRTKNNFYNAIQEINSVMAVVPQFPKNQLCAIRATLNSYLGCTMHANSFNLRKKMLGKLIKRFYDFFLVTKDFKKVSINEDFWLWHFSPNYRFTN